MIKKISIALVCCLLSVAVAFVLPRISSSELMVEPDSICINCHIGDRYPHNWTALHTNSGHTNCVDCHENPEGGTGDVSSSNCLACHPGSVPGVNAGKCDLIDFHVGNPDYIASGESCFAANCHLEPCSEGTSTTTSGPASTTTSSIDGGGCPATEIYGEGSVEVEVMRTIRDDVMSRTPEGREIIKLYYQWAPFIAAAIRNDNELKSEIKEMIDGILGLTVK